MTTIIRFLSPIILLVAASLPAQAFDTRAEAAFVVDLTTDTVLLSKNADEPLPPASMSKLMTLYVAFEALKEGRLSMQERLPVSTHAMSYGGSTMFLDTTDRVTVEDLLRGIVVLSGNDACVVIAEALSPDGTEAGFARYMTQRGQQMGLTNSTFRNSNGWPAAGHRMSLRDLALLSRRIIEDFPDYYEMFAETEFEFDGRAPQNTQNRNPLLNLGIGVDGLKTGHTSEAGYGLTASAEQGDRRIVLVIAGMETARARAEEAEAIVSWAFRQFVERSVVTAGSEVARADVWMGGADTVGLAPTEDVRTLLPVLEADSVAARILYEGPVRAPVTKGDQLGEMIIAPEGLPERTVPLVAAEDVAKGGFTRRLITASSVLLQRLRQGPEGAL